MVVNLFEERVAGTLRQVNMKLEECLRICLQDRLGADVDFSTISLDRLKVLIEHDRSNTYLLDGEPILSVGPLKVEREDGSNVIIRVSQDFKRIAAAQDAPHD